MIINDLTFIYGNFRNKADFFENTVFIEVIPNNLI